MSNHFTYAGGGAEKQDVNEDELCSGMRILYGQVRVADTLRQWDE